MDKFLKQVRESIPPPRVMYGPNQHWAITPQNTIACVAAAASLVVRDGNPDLSNVVFMKHNGSVWAFREPEYQI